MAAPAGLYNLIRSSVATSTAITVNQVLAPLGTAIEVTRCWCNQDNTTTTNQTRIQLNRCVTAGTVTSQTPQAAQNGMQASKCVGGVAATGITATIEPATPVTWWQEGFNIVNGILYLPVPEARMLVVGQASGSLTPLVTVKFPAAPANATYTTGVEWLEYVG
jgi:hypothetical protein